MEVKELCKEEVRDYVRLLFTCHEEEFTHVFGDTFLAMEIMIDHYSKLEDYEGIFVAKAGRKVAGLIEVWIREKSRALPYREFMRAFGFVKGLKCRLLMSYFGSKPGRREAYIRHFCVHPSVSLDYARALLDRAIEFAAKRGKKKMSVWLPVESDLVDICVERGFEIKKMLDSDFAEKHFGKRYYYLLILEPL